MKRAQILPLLLLVTGLFLVRMLVNFAHGHAHDTLAVPLAPWQQAYVWIVIVIAPIGALAWLWVRPSPPAAWSLAGLLIASWLFGLYFHFGPMNPDHVSAQQGADRHLFAYTAVAIGIVEPLNAAAAAWLARSLARAGGLRHA